jgi:hypothetical protein
MGSKRSKISKISKRSKRSIKSKDYCSPGKGNNFSCIPTPILKQIAIILNKQPECSKIKLNCQPRKLYDEVKKEISKISDCNREPCWLKVEPIINHLNPKERRGLKRSFRPEKPASWNNNPIEWLNTENINNVMHQYEEAHPSFKYYGALPIDFDSKDSMGNCLNGELCKIDLKGLINKGKQSIGIVFNIDPSTKGGQHWFSIFVDLVGKNLNKPFIYYFDSAKGEIQTEIYNFINNLKGQYEQIYPSKELNFTFNDIQHQYKNTECGIYCIHFLTTMLEGTGFDEYINNKITDDEMQTFRDVFFI